MADFRKNWNPHKKSAHYNLVQTERKIDKHFFILRYLILYMIFLFQGGKAGSPSISITPLPGRNSPAAAAAKKGTNSPMMKPGQPGWLILL